MVSLLFHSSNYLTSPAILYLYKKQLTLKIEYCYHIWERVDKSSLETKKRFHVFVFDNLFYTLETLSHRRNVGRLSLLYGKCSDELDFFQF